MWHDLSLPDYTPPDVPLWAREEDPDWLRPFRGINGLGTEWREVFSGANAMVTAGIDRYQANHFVVFRPETASYLRHDYTPREVGYRPGTFPVLESLAAEAVGRATRREDIAEALLMGPSRALRHPSVPPLGPEIPAHRNLGEEELLRSGVGWCNEQTRVFVRLCQTQNIPARIIHLFYSTPPIGHTVAEFHTGERWCLVDASYFIIFRSEDGTPLSAEDCHDRGRGQHRYGQLADEAICRLLAAASAVPPENRCSRLEDFVRKYKDSTPEIRRTELDGFGAINHPLPKV